MKVFITGGTGFIGKTLTKVLAKRGHKLCLLTRNVTKHNHDTHNIEYAKADLGDPQKIEHCIKKFKPDFLIHLAWEGLPDYSINLCKKNLEYGLNLFTASVNAGCSNILSTGTCWEYFKKQGSLLEDDQLDTQSVFPAVKTALRSYGEAITHQNGGKFYWLRLFYVYGPSQRQSSLIPHILNSIDKGIMPGCKTPYNQNDFIYVDDVAKAIGKVIEKKPDGTVYNIGSGYSTQILEVMLKAFEMEQVPFKTDYILKNSNPTKTDDAKNQINFWADITKISNHTGWKPEHNLESGLQKIKGLKPNDDMEA